MTTNTPPAARRLLLVIDEGTARLPELERALRREGFAVIVATSGTDAVAALPLAAPDVVVSTAVDGGAEGPAFMAEIRRQRPQAARISLAVGEVTPPAIEAVLHEVRRRAA